MSILQFSITVVIYHTLVPGRGDNIILVCIKSPMSFVEMIHYLLGFPAKIFSILSGFRVQYVCSIVHQYISIHVCFMVIAKSFTKNKHKTSQGNQGMHILLN